MFDSLFNLTPSAVSLNFLTIAIVLILSFVFTLILIGVLIAVIMMVVGNSLAIAFGAFGAFSLIRFRTAIKDTRDLAFVLLVVTIGLAVGTRNYLIAILTTIFAGAIIFGLTKINFGSIRKYDYLLNFSAFSDKFSAENLRSVFAEFLKYDNLLNVTAKEGGKVLTYTFNIKFIKAAEIEKLITKISQLEGIFDIDVISAKNDIEY